MNVDCVRNLCIHEKMFRFGVHSKFTITIHILKTVDLRLTAEKT